ncbi:MAG: DUF4250 domain-containing protein [Bacteroidales bacterium]|nr:DUF4250 domain-containing protein [Bacteroidales bacterium]
MEMTDYPKDPMMLLSWVNMKLRDFYPSLEDLCSDMEIDLEGLVKKLSEAGFEYNRDLNKFW